MQETQKSKTALEHGIVSTTNFKVEIFLKGSLDLIPSPSPSVKIQIMSGKVCLRCKGKTFEYKKFVDIPSSKLFLKFSQFEGDGIQSRLPS